MTESCNIKLGSNDIAASGLPERVYGNVYSIIRKTVTGIAAKNCIIMHSAAKPVQYRNTFKIFFITDLTLLFGFNCELVFKALSGTVDPSYL